MMEILDTDNGRRRKEPAKKNEGGPFSSAPMRTLAPPPLPVRASVPDEVKLAALAVDLNVRLRSADMPAAMQARAIRRTRALLGSNVPDKNRRVSPTHLAMCLKKEFDAMYGPAWHCIAGKSFGSFVTHSCGGFLYFSADNFSLLLFKISVKPPVNTNPP